MLPSSSGICACVRWSEPSPTEFPNQNAFRSRPAATTSKRWIRPVTRPRTQLVGRDPGKCSELHRSVRRRDYIRHADSDDTCQHNGQPHAHPDLSAGAHSHAHPDLSAGAHPHAHPDLSTGVHSHAHPDLSARHSPRHPAGRRLPRLRPRLPADNDPAVVLLTQVSGRHLEDDSINPAESLLSVRLQRRIRRPLPRESARTRAAAAAPSRAARSASAMSAATAAAKASASPGGTSTPASPSVAGSSPTA